MVEVLLQGAAHTSLLSPHTLPFAHGSPPLGRRLQAFFHKEIPGAAASTSSPSSDGGRKRREPVLQLTAAFAAAEGQDLAKQPEGPRLSDGKDDNGAVGAETRSGNGAMHGAEALDGWEHSSQAPYRLVELRAELRGVQDYMARAPDFARPDSGPPRWFCPVECGCPPDDAPLLLFLPGMDGTGLGLIRHHESLGRLFEVRCLHIPFLDRTPVEGLIAIVESTLKDETQKHPSRPIYLVGDSLGGALALAVAARNPTMDLVLTLANPATCFNSSQLLPFFPLMEGIPAQIYEIVPFLLSSTMGDPVRMALAKVDKGLSAFDKVQALSDNLTALLPTLPILADIVPKETLLWKIELLRSTAMYANSRLHAVKADVLVLASGKDQMLPSRDEAERLRKTLKSCVIRYFKDSGHTLLLEDGIDLAYQIRGANLYRHHKTFDPVSDFVYPTTEEFAQAFERNKLFRQLCSPVFFSKKEDGTIVRGLSGVPEDRPILLVGYHMLMGLELGPLVTEFLKRKQLIRGIAHPILFSRALERGLTEPGFYDDVRVFGGVPATKRGFFKVMARRESALLYPGGAREALHRKGEAYKLFWPENSEFIRTAARFGMTIVPFGAVGEDDLLELLLDYDELKQLPFFSSTFQDANQKQFQIRRGAVGEVAKQELHLPLLAPKPPGRMYFLFGKPYDTTGKGELLQKNREAANKAYHEIKEDVEDCLQYLLKKREEDPYRGFFPRFLLETLWGGDWQVPTFKP